MTETLVGVLSFCFGVAVTILCFGSSEDLTEGLTSKVLTASVAVGAVCLLGILLISVLPA